MTAVLVIRHEQMDAFRERAEAECLVTLEELLRESFPLDASRLTGDELRAVVRLGMERSRAHGGVATRDMYLFLAVMFMLGSGFDEDPQLPWAQDLFRQGEPIARVHAEALTYLDAVAGEENEHLIKALVRARGLELPLLPQADAPDFESRMLAWLRSVYPTKFEAQGEAATLDVLSLARALAAQHALPGSGTALLALLAFLLGTSFDRDPLHPWIQSVLDRPADDGDKVEELLRRGVAFANLALR